MSQTESSADLKRAGRRVGYVIAVAINVVLLVVVNNVLEWGWFGFLTEDFTDVVPWINLSLLVSLVANLIYVLNDTPVVKSAGQLASNVVALIASYQLFRVFPFDFSGYDFDWGIVVRVLLVVAMVGAAIGAITEAFKLGAAVRRSPPRSQLSMGGQPHREP